MTPQQQAQNDLVAAVKVWGHGCSTVDVAEAAEAFVDSLEKGEAKCEECERLRKVLRMDDPWPLASILEELIRGAQILFEVYDYDDHGWEALEIAMCRARDIKSALAAPAKATEEI